MRLIVATHNNHKLDEIKDILIEQPFEIVSLTDVGFTQDIIEDGDSFAANALIKVRAVAAKFPQDIVFADDSGLCIDCLGGEPGIHSARFMGEDCPYALKNAALIAAVDRIAPQERAAHFSCAIACYHPLYQEFVVEGFMYGEIAKSICGEHGFGYDPIFFLPQYRLTSAELKPAMKNRISHRAKALELFRDKLAELEQAKLVRI